MYFNHAFRKSFLPGINGQPIAPGGVVTPLVAGSTATLTPGEIGFFNAKTWQVQAASANPFVIAQGSYFTNDKIGPYHGGYQESVKSKVINPKYITRLITVNHASAQNQIQEVCVCNLECGKTYRLRIDLKGSPALRFLSHNIYKTLDAFTGCCTDDCTATCTGALVDPTIAVIKWATQIVNDPYLPQFIRVAVTDFNGDLVAEQESNSAEDIKAFLEALENYSPDPAWNPNGEGASTSQACLLIEAAYIETKFGNCTFTPTDFYELQPLEILPSVVDESGDPCNVQCVTITETQTAAQASGVGETVLRELILDGRYLQNAFPDSSRIESFRMREIEADPALSTVDRNGLYDQVLILHSVPRFNNPTGTFDNDQYLLKFHVPATVDTTAITNYILAAATAAGNNDLVLEAY
jgi:hypothetical protein